jgi:probable F420-dependent oxidoreductase
LTAGEKGTEDWPVVIAALGPKMLELAGARTQGAIPYNTTPAHTASARAKIPDGKWLAVEQKVTLETDPTAARALGRKELSRYLVLDNYRNAWLGMGFTEQDLSDGGSDRFIDAMVLWGDAATVKAALRKHYEAGATHLCIQPVHPEGDTAARDAILAALADT